MGRDGYGERGGGIENKPPPLCAPPRAHQGRRRALSSHFPDGRGSKHGVHSVFRFSGRESTFPRQLLWHTGKSPPHISPPRNKKCSPESQFWFRFCSSTGQTDRGLESLQRKGALIVVVERASSESRESRAFASTDFAISGQPFPRPFRGSCEDDARKRRRGRQRRAEPRSPDTQFRFPANGLCASVLKRPAAGVVSSSSDRLATTLRDVRVRGSNQLRHSARTAGRGGRGRTGGVQASLPDTWISRSIPNTSHTV